MSTERPLSPPPTPLWNESPDESVYPSPTSSSSNPGPKRRPSLKPSFSTKSTSIRENVQVMVRCRPRSLKEMQFDEEPCWLISPEEGSIELARLKSPLTIRTFNFDNVVMGVDNEQVYKAGILDLVRSAMMGYNGTVFAYGQTASGKTYANNGTETEPGVIPRAVREVFSYIEEDTTGREFLLRVSYMEIYNEKIKDLLNTQNTNPEIVEDKKGVRVRNLKEVIVKTAQEVLDCIKEGEGNRHISATDYNEHSSRSHTIFQLVIESRSKGLPTSSNKGVRFSQLNLIDLAGSEKVATDIERRKEGGYINRSLLTLGSVISKLTSDEPSTHIPFRNSKLTRILQAALSGNARISVICTINPTFASKDESLNTLRFAQRAKLIKTAAKMTRIVDNSELQNCLLKIAELQTKMQEKNDLEAETRERLKSLLGLILTSTKDEHPDQLEMSTYFSNISANDLMKESTMRDVVARCEEGFAAQITTHQKKMDNMTLHVEHMQDMMSIMESLHTKKNDILSKKDAQIEKLKQELAAAKNPIRATKTPIRATKSAVRITKTPRVTPILPTSRSIVPASKPLHNSTLFNVTEHEASDKVSQAAQPEESQPEVPEASQLEESEASQPEKPEASQPKKSEELQSKKSEELLPDKSEVKQPDDSELKASQSDEPELKLSELEVPELAVSGPRMPEVSEPKIPGVSEPKVPESKVPETTELKAEQAHIPKVVTPTDNACKSKVTTTLATASPATAAGVKITEQEEDYDIVDSFINDSFKLDVSQDISSQPDIFNKEVDIPTQKIIPSSTFISIHEAVSFFQPVYQILNEIAIVESFSVAEVPELIQQALPELPKDQVMSIDCILKTPQDYEPYSKSVDQPFPLSFLFNRWTFLCAIIYVLVQTS